MSFPHCAGTIRNPVRSADGWKQKRPWRCVRGRIARVG